MSALRHHQAMHRRRALKEKEKEKNKNGSEGEENVKMNNDFDSKKNAGLDDDDRDGEGITTDGGVVNIIIDSAIDPTGTGTLGGNIVLDLKEEFKQFANDTFDIGVDYIADSNGGLENEFLFY